MECKTEFFDSSEVLPFDVDVFENQTTTVKDSGVKPSKFEYQLQLSGENGPEVYLQYGKEYRLQMASTHKKYKVHSCFAEFEENSVEVCL